MIISTAIRYLITITTVLLTILTGGYMEDSRNVSTITRVSKKRNLHQQLKMHITQSNTITKKTTETDTMILIKMIYLVMVTSVSLLLTINHFICVQIRAKRLTLAL